MSRKRKRKLNNAQARSNDNKSNFKSNKSQTKADDYDFEGAVYPDNSCLKVPPEDDKTYFSEGDIVLRKIGKEAVVGEYNFINVAVVFLLIMIMGISFALLRNTDEYIENDNKISAETVLNGKFTKRLSKNYIKRLPGKQLLLDTHRVFSYTYGIGSFNDERGFVAADTGKIIGIKTYDEPMLVTLATKPTAPTTTTQYTGKTTNTTQELTGTLFIGPGQLTTTKKTKKTTTKKTKEKTTTTTSETTTAFTGTTWSFKGTTTVKQSTTSAPQTTTSTTTTVLTEPEYDTNVDINYGEQ